MLLCWREWNRWHFSKNINANIRSMKRIITIAVMCLSCAGSTYCPRNDLPPRKFQSDFRGAFFVDTNITWVRWKRISSQFFFRKSPIYENYDFCELFEIRIKSASRIHLFSDFLSYVHRSSSNPGPIQLQSKSNSAPILNWYSYGVTLYLESSKPEFS